MKFIATLLLFKFSVIITVVAQKVIIEEKVKFLALGDSYTIGQSVSVSERWPVQLITMLREKGFDCYDPTIIATTGWRTDNLKNAVVNANLSHDYNLVSLLIGVNNFYQGRSIETYSIEFEELLTMAIALASGDTSRVFVVSIPDYGYTPFGESKQQSISKGIDAFNNVNKTISEKLNVAYYNITDISRRGLNEPDLVASDGLHPSGKMYKEWAELILADASLIDATGDTGGGGEVITGSMNENNSIQVFPNPFASEIIFKNLPEEHLTIQLIDNLGKVAIQTKSLREKEFLLDTALLKNGIYYYQLVSNHGILTHGKLIRN